MAKKIDLTGQRFGRLVVIGRSEEKRSYWNCRCDCGNEKDVRSDHLKSGSISSCGCYNSELSRNRMRDIDKKQWQDEEFRQKQRNGIKEKWKDEEYRQMQSNKMKQQWENKEYRQMQSNKVREQWENEEFRQMMSNKMKQRWKDEEYRQMQSNKAKKQWKDEEFRQMQSNKTKEQWKDEEMKWKMGYKGGITPISIYLRGLPVVKEWRKNTYTRENNKCQLTGKHVHGGNSDVHHLHSFNMIVLEAHELHNIQIHEIVSEYTQEELYKLEQYIEKWHKDTSNAVLLCEEVHKLFHVLYKYGNNTPEQYEEFKQRYLSGEFEKNIK